MTSNDSVLLKSLLDRLEADAEKDKPDYRSIVSDAERQALRTVLVEAGVIKSHLQPILEQPTPSFRLNTQALEYTSTPLPGWTLCLDFGTAKSKACAAAQGDDPENIVPLALGKADGDPSSVHDLHSSIWITDDGRIFMGYEALKRSMQPEKQSGRRRLDSLKQEISGALDLDNWEGTLLPSDVNPTSTELTYVHAITAYLAYLTDIATTQLASDLGKPLARYVQRRFTVPAWSDARRDKAGSILKRAFLHAQLLADTFRGQWRSGIPVDDLRLAVERASQYERQIAWIMAESSDSGILEALAAASARVWHDGTARNLMLVVDVGAGTTDLALFCVVQKDGTVKRAFPIMPCSEMIEVAGDTIDDLLLSELILRADRSGDDGLKRRHSLHFRNDIRRRKEELFRNGRTVVDPLDDGTPVTVELNDFLALEGIGRFETKIVETVEQFLHRVDATWQTIPGPISLVLTGGGCGLPMILRLAERDWQIGQKRFIARLAGLPDFVETHFSEEVQREYPKLAVAMGGAMEMRLDEKKTMSSFLGKQEPPGQLDQY